MEFNDIQINQWRAYERVRVSGRHNMFAPQALAATRLSEEEYAFVMRNFDALRSAALKDDKQ